MSKPYIALTILLGAAIGAGGYHLLLRGGGTGDRPGGGSGDAASLRAELSEVRRHLTAVEARLARVEAKPGR